MHAPEQTRQYVRRLAWLALLTSIAGCGNGTTLKETRWGNGQMQSRVTVRPNADGQYIEDGPYWVWYANGQLKEEGHYVEGQFDGRIVHYWENGTKKAESVWEKGRLIEPWQEWDAQGKPLPPKEADAAQAPEH